MRINDRRKEKGEKFFITNESIGTSSKEIITNRLHYFQARKIMNFTQICNIGSQSFMIQRSQRKILQKNASYMYKYVKKKHITMFEKFDLKFFSTV